MIEGTWSKTDSQVVESTLYSVCCVVGVSSVRSGHQIVGSSPELLVGVGQVVVECRQNKVGWPQRTTTKKNNEQRQQRQLTTASPLPQLLFTPNIRVPSTSTKIPSFIKSTVFNHPYIMTSQSASLRVAVRDAHLHRNGTFRCSA